ncbi:hypothetical protein A6A29_31535 [Streptomyces sp. TSRI0281]|nr:hypothetical protein A6A29_31535 [Streptomyces sp. TSRI0281]
MGPMFDQRSRTRRTNADVRAAQDRVYASRAALTATYQEGAGMAVLAAEYGVSRPWLRERFVEWGVPVRGRRTGVGGDAC